MANTYIVSGTNFKPYTFDEMIKPYQIYTEAYNKADLELNTLMEDAATKAFNFAPQDVVEKQAYDDMMSRLSTASDKLAKSGLNPQLIKDIQNINKDYRKVMIPIQEKINKRGELAAEQRKLQTSNPFLRFSKDYSTAGLDGITKASTYDVIDLSKVEQLASSEFAGITSSVLKKPEYKPILGSQYYEVTEGYGYTPEEMIKGLQNKNSSIYKFYEDAISKLNLSKYDPSTQEDIKKSVISGMMSSAGKFSTQMVSNKNWSDTPKKTDAELQKYLDAVPKNTDFVFDGDIYHKDDTGRAYKIGTQKDVASSSSSSGSGSGSSKDRIGRPKQGLKISFKTKRKNPEEVKKQMTSTFNPNEIDAGNSKIVTYDELPLYAQLEVDNYRGEDVVENYVYMYNEKDEELYVIPKDINIVQNETVNVDAI